MVVSQRAFVEASRKTQQTQALHPGLKAALGSLDVDLEDELTRYRRQRAGYPAPPPRGAKPLASMPKSLDLIAIYPDGQRAHAARGQNGTKPANPSIETTVSPSLQTGEHLASKGATKSLKFSPSPSRVGPQLGATLDVDSDPLETASQPSVNPQEATSLKPALVKVEPAKNREEPEGVGRDLASLAPTNPYDYLESSEELLKSLSEEEPDFNEPNVLSNLFTPLGVGSMLVLLLSSATLGYLVMNPSSLQHLKLSKLFRVPQTTIVSGSKTGDTTPGSAAQPGSQGSNLPNSPDLSAKEFVNLDINTLSTLKPEATTIVPNLSTEKAAPSSTVGNSQPVAGQNPSVGITGTGAVATTGSTTGSTGYSPATITPPGASSAPIPTQPSAAQPVRSATVAPLPAVIPSSAPASSASFPAPSQRSTSSASPSQVSAPASNAKQPVVAPQPTTASTTSQSSSPNGQPNYIVVTPYTGDQTLESARKVVPNAYVRNLPEGAKVQLGAFTSPDKAEGLVQQLQEQGIQAEIKPR